MYVLLKTFLTCYNLPQDPGSRDPNVLRTLNIEGGNIEDVENRVTGLEDDMKLFKTLMIKGKDHDTVNKRLSIAEGTV